MLPNYLVAGSMRCGTSALFRGLVNHDDVFGARGKEIHYFDRNYEKGPEWYATHFADHGGATAVGEGTPYLGDEPAMTRMVTDLPEAKLIVILRQPVDRAYSHYWHNRRREREDRSFEEAFRTDLHSEEAIGPWMNYWRLGKFATYLERLASAVDRDLIHVTFSEDLRDKREETLHAAWRHIGVDPRGGRMEVPPRTGFRKLIRSTKNAIKGRTDDRSYPPIDKSTRNELTEVYRDDILQLQDFVGRDLSYWLKRR